MKDTVSIDDFSKLDIRVGLVVSAEPVAGSEKLLKLEVDFGGEVGKRQILSGIAKHYSPVDLENTSHIFVINLEFRKIMGLESQGMILAAGAEETIATLVPDKVIAAGSEIR